MILRPYSYLNICSDMFQTDRIMSRIAAAQTYIHGRGDEILRGYTAASVRSFYNILAAEETGGHFHPDHELSDELTRIRLI